MQNLNRHISIVLLLLILFPLAEKAWHEREHMDLEPCGVKDKHFCKAEHSCEICDYVFASSVGPAKSGVSLVLFSRTADKPVLVNADPIPTTLKLSVFLRGPPMLT